MSEWTCTELHRGLGKNTKISWVVHEDIVGQKDSGLVCECLTKKQANRIVREHNAFGDLLEACQEAYVFCMSIKGNKSRDCSARIAKAIAKSKVNA